MKRFQECSKIIQIWRYRWYLLIPFQYIYHIVKPFKVYQDELLDNGDIVHTNNYDVLKGKVLWSILKGIAQGHMKWHYTMEEVMSKINKKWKNN